jgi:squalene-hopene/tetraprenyl-beta-curcumene cyclase
MHSLANSQNADGGFGDTDRSHSNIATSFLVLAAATLSSQATGQSLSPLQIDRLNVYIRQCGELTALRQRYGTDKTFVVPILTNLAIAGLVDWDQVPALPFEAAVFPQSMYRWLQMPVVSYAIPALVAIGQARHFLGRKAPLPLRLIRSASLGRSLNVLRRMQPPSGGYLEATPLTSFVVMSLAATGRTNEVVCSNGLRFLIDSMNEQGSWPIDTNLATWVTSLSIDALSCDPDDDGQWCTPELIQWHLSCQHLRRHPFTGAEPGGWGWSDLEGAVPDSDDTPAAILALSRVLRWCPRDDQRSDILQAMESGRDWLLRLQNRDGGWPTFCRGWGKLPFDRSSTDLTAHAIRALREPETLGIPANDDWNAREGMEGSSIDAHVLNHKLRKVLLLAQKFLLSNQQPDGSWLPLWFGNQDRRDETNPVYGTARVLAAGVDFLGLDATRRGCAYLIASQNSDGGWGGGPSVTEWLGRASDRKSVPPPSSTRSGPVISSMEETSLAVHALASALESQQHPSLRSRSHQNGLQRNQGSESGVELPRRPSVTVGVPVPVRPRFPEYEPSGDSDSKEMFADRVSEWDWSLNDTDGGGKSDLVEAIIRGVEFLLARIDEDRHHVAWPIGFYFAKLWYHEKLYPLIFSTAALGKFLQASAATGNSDWPRLRRPESSTIRPHDLSKRNTDCRPD